MGKIKFKIDGNISQTNQIGNNTIKLSGEISPEKEECELLQNKNDNPYRDHKFEKGIAWWKTVSIVSIVLAIASVITTIFIRVDYNLEIVSQLLVIAFIGGLATFVVVSNYMQVKDIEGRFVAEVIKLNVGFDKKIEDLNIVNDKKINAAKFKIEIRAVSAARLSLDTNAIVEHLSYAILDANETNDDFIIDELIITIRNELRSDIKPFLCARVALVEFCLEKFDCPLLANERIKGFKDQIGEIYNNRKKCGEIISYLNRILKTNVDAIPWENFVNEYYPYLKNLKNLELYEKNEIKTLLNNKKFNQLEGIDKVRGILRE
jgi:hypothetical protein